MNEPSRSPAGGVIEGDRWAGRFVPGLGHGALIVLVLMAGQLAVGGAFDVLRSGMPPWIVAIVAALVATAVALTVVRRWWRLDLDEVLPFGNPAGSVMAALVPLTIGMQILFSELDNLLQFLWPMPPEMKAMLADLIGGNIITALLVLVIVAPLTEEVLFRGAVLGGLLRGPNILRAIAVSSLLFAAAHANPWQFVGAFFAGMVFGWLRVRTNSIVPGLWGHALMNAVPVLAMQMLPPITGFTEMRDTPALQPLWLDAIGVVLVYVGARLLLNAIRQSTGVSGWGVDDGAAVPIIAAGAAAPGSPDEAATADGAGTGSSADGASSS